MDTVLTKVSLGTSVLQDLVARAVKGSTMVDIIPMSCLMQLKIKDNVLTIRTTDNINYLTETTTVNAPDFEIVVRSKLFAQTIAKLTTEVTSIYLDGNKVIIEANGKYTLPLSTDADGSAITFPEPTFTAVGNTYHLTSEQVRTILTLNKSCKADMKELPAIFNYYMDDKHVITSNQFKACLNPVKMFDTPTCLPPNLVELIPMVVDSTEGVDVKADDSSVWFESKLGTLYGKKCPQAEVDAFPAAAIVEVLGMAMDHECVVNRTKLENALDRMILFTDELQSYKLSVTFSNSSLVLNNAETESHEEVDYITPLVDSFEPIKFNIDASFLKSELSACATEALTVKFSAEAGIQLICGDATLALSVLDEDMPE